MSLSSLTQWTAQFFSADSYTQVLAMLIRVNVYNAMLTGTLGVCVCVMYMTLVNNEPANYFVNLRMWEKFEHAEYEYCLLAHNLLLPVAVVDIGVVMPWLAKNFVTEYDLAKAMPYHAFGITLFTLYYWVLLTINYWSTGSYPYPILNDLHRHVGYLKGWIPFVTVVILAECSMAWFLTHMLPTYEL